MVSDSCAWDTAAMMRALVLAETMQSRLGSFISRTRMALGIEASAKNKVKQSSEKVAPPRRKYKMGDVVFYDNRLWFVHRDESEDGIVEMSRSKTLKIKVYCSDLDLVCAYGERADVNRIRKNTEERREHDLGV